LIVGIIIGSIIGAIALVLCIPVYGSIEVRVEERFRSRFSLRWLFGAVKRQVSSEKAGPVGDSGGRPKLLSGVPSDSQAKARVGRLLRAVVRSTRVESLEADFRLGLDDPADTALLFGPLGAASVLLSLHTGRNIWLLPALEGETCQGYLSARFRWLPIRLVRPVMSLLASKAGRRMAKLALLRR
jgi:hypothetical protein